MESDILTQAEIVKQEITRLMELQRIKKANNGAPNQTLDECITESFSTLHALGVNTDSFKII